MGSLGFTVIHSLIYYLLSGDFRGDDDVVEMGTFVTDWFGVVVG
jgi:hypothetical protein